MSLGNGILRETAFMLRDKSILFWMIAVLLLSSFAVWSGVQDVQKQNSLIENLVKADNADRAAIGATQSDWGGLAYYSFHLTYDPPSDFAFAAMGQRDQISWKHRVRMLALEGQIYESDAGHPEFSVIGRFDFAFLTAFTLPLILIAILHDIRARERAAGRYAFLEATAGNSRALWRLRIALRTALITACLLLPLILGALWSGTNGMTLILAMTGVILYATFWALVCAIISKWDRSSPVLLSTLIGLWIGLAVIIPSAGRVTIESAVPIPAGGDIVLTQRETVSDAWDLPKEATMSKFLEQNPEWENHTQVSRPFEWKWYYAFQQVGDQTTEPLTKAYRKGREKRDRLAGLVSIISPPALMERSLQKIAQTDTQSLLSYEDHVRSFHTELRHFYYPKLFLGQPFNKDQLTERPKFNARMKTSFEND